MLAFAYTYFMRVPAINKALHESVGAVRIQSFNTRSSKNLKRGVLFNHKKDKVCVMTNRKLFLLKLVLSLPRGKTSNKMHADYFIL